MSKPNSRKNMKAKSSREPDGSRVKPQRAKAPPEAKQKPQDIRLCIRSGRRPPITAKFGRKLAVGQFIFCTNCGQEILTKFDGGYTFTNHTIPDDKEGVEMGASN